MWTAALLHGTLNAPMALASAQHYPAGERLVVDVFGLTYAVILALCVVVPYLTVKRDSARQGRIGAGFYRERDDGQA